MGPLLLLQGYKIPVLRLQQPINVFVDRRENNKGLEVKNLLDHIPKEIQDPDSVAFDAFTIKRIIPVKKGSRHDRAIFTQDAITPPVRNQQPVGRRSARTLLTKETRYSKVRLLDDSIEKFQKIPNSVVFEKTISAKHYRMPPEERELIYGDITLEEIRQIQPLVRKYTQLHLFSH